MFTEIFRFEMIRKLKRISTYLFFIFFLLCGYFAIYFAILGGGPLKRVLQAGSGDLLVNPPFVLYYLINYMSRIGLLISSGYFINAAFDDMNLETACMYYSYPYSKASFFLARYFSAFFSSFLVLSGTGVGALIASVSSTNYEVMAPFNLFSYVQPYLTGVIPALLFTGAILFALILLTGKIFSAYTALLLLLALSFAGSGLAGLENAQTIAALLDPFGSIASAHTYSFWSISEKNLLLLPFTGDLLINRVLWLTIGIIILYYSYRKLNFRLFFKENTKERDEKESREIKSDLQKVSRDFSFKSRLLQFHSLLKLELKSLILNRYFLIILLISLIFLLVIGGKNIGSISGELSYPVTSEVVKISGDVFYLFFLIFSIFCAGELIWRDREKKVNLIIDQVPVSNQLLYSSKVAAILTIQLLLVTMIMICGIILQIINQYYNYEISLYLKELFGIKLIYFSLLSIFFLFIHLLSKNKHLGHVLSAVIYFFLFDEDTFPMLGAEHTLFRYASVPKYYYSNMLGYAHFAKAIFYHHIFWSAVALLLAVFSILFYKRGSDENWKVRFKKAGQGTSKKVLLSLSFSLFLLTIMGSAVIYNTNILNTYETNNSRDLKKVEYENLFIHFKHRKELQIVAIKMETRIFPSDRTIENSGVLTFENKYDFEIDEIFIQMPEKSVESKLSFNRDVELLGKSIDHGVYIYKLGKPVKPGETGEIDFKITLVEQGFKNNEDHSGYANMILTQNGIFVDSIFLVPSIGYDPYHFSELEDNDKREKYGLPFRESIPSAGNTSSSNRMIKDSGWIEFDALVSTENDFKALTSGELINQWQEKERNYFHFRSKEKMLKAFSIISAKYEVQRDKWENINMEIYYQEGHEYNLDLMMEAMKESLSYYTKVFGPYQSEQIRIVEYPQYKLGAECYPDMIPISEGFGFITKRDPQKLDYHYKVNAHEVAHMWWGYQVEGAYEEGSILLTEMLSQYSALMVCRLNYPEQQIDQFIKTQMNDYFKGRSRETNGERTLAKTDLKSWYLNYSKGIIVFNALQAYMGEEKLNNILKEYLEENRYRDSPPSTSGELISLFKERIPSELGYLVTEMFEETVIYDNEILSGEANAVGKNKYDVTIGFSSTKSSKSEDQSSLVYFSVSDEAGNELYCGSYWIEAGENQLTITVEGIPYKIAIDPHYYLIDSDLKNNFLEDINIAGPL